MQIRSYESIKSKIIKVVLKCDNNLAVIKSDDH
jgi:hypothetical protein